MADQEQQAVDDGLHQVSGRTMVLTSLAGIVMGGPLLGMMGLSFLASLILLVVTSPLLIIFSPLLFGAACILAFSMAGFAVSAAMAFAGMATFTWIYRSLVVGPGKSLGFRFTDKLIESAEDSEEPGKD